MRVGLAWSALFVVAEILGRLTHPDDSPVAFLWPAAGIGLLWVLSWRGGRRRWALVSIALLDGAINALTGATLLGVLALMSASALTPWVSAAALEQFEGASGRRTRPRLSGTKDLYRLAVATTIGALASAPLGVSGWTEDGLDDHLALAAAAWVLRYAVGSALVVAVVLTWRNRRSHPGLDWATWESVAAVAVTGLAYAAVFVPMPLYPSAFLVVPLALWTGVRAGPLRATLHGLGAAVVSVIATLADRGPFGLIADPVEQSVFIQSFVAVVAMVALALSLALEDRRRALSKMSQARAVLQRTLDSAPIGHAVISLGADRGRISYANPALHALVGVSHDLVGMSWFDLVAPGDRAVAEGVSWDMAHGAGPWRGELRHRGRGDCVRWCETSLAPMTVDDGTPANRPEEASLQLLDVTVRREFAERLGYQAMHDELTGLPNRLLLADRLDHAVARSRRSRQELALVFLDLDHFKTVNDSLGHTAGDAVIVAIAERLHRAVRPSDTVARIGGDEFVVLCPEIAGRDHAAEIVARLLEAIGEPIDIDGRSITMSVSAGIAMAQELSDADALLREADTAMYQAKARGRGRAEFFEQSLYVQAQRKLRLTTEMRRALADDELVVHYQPLVRLDSGLVVAVEALVRWQHPQRGLLAPGEWLDVIEHTDLMPQLGSWVLREAVRQASHLHAGGSRDHIRVHVNVSATQLHQPGMLDTVSRALADASLDPTRLVLELTETQLINAHTELLPELQALRELGVTLSIDDFGTFYSSLTQLTTMPIDEVKIDRSFILTMHHDRRARAIVQAILGMADAIGLDVVAEGVENEETAEVLRQWGCTMGQGHLWSPAKPWESIVPMLVGSSTG
ncbi:MAG: hypothetical protein RI958_1681 [Actinomycetota bacterium]|jgi:diguanylate cyclase (GGDEF)-like protein